MACKNKLHIVFRGTHTVCAMLTECEQKQTGTVGTTKWFQVLQGKNRAIN